MVLEARSGSHFRYWGSSETPSLKRDASDDQDPSEVIRSTGVGSLVTLESNSLGDLLRKQADRFAGPFRHGCG